MEDAGHVMDLLNEDLWWWDPREEEASCDDTSPKGYLCVKHPGHDGCHVATTHIRVSKDLPLYDVVDVWEGGKSDG